MKTIQSIFVFTLVSTSAFSAQGQTCAQSAWGGGTTGLNFVSSMGATLDNAMDVWNNTCGPQAPPLSRSTSSVSGLLNITTQHLANGFPCQGFSDACACSQRQSDQGGNTTGGTISVFDYAADGEACIGDIEARFAHEIGHFLGLNHVTDPNCASNVMYFAPVASGVTSAQCNLVDSMWGIPNEDPCDNDPPAQGCDNGQDPPGSPIVIDLDRDGFRFTSPDSGVEFDLDSDGVAERIAWVGNPRDAFLFLDLNGNNLVDDGRELFGNYTVLLDGTRAVHGFEALAELDLPDLAGNGDGTIDQWDWGYHLLGLWLDWNLNGVSEAGELVSLAESRVRSISLTYFRNRRQDRFGNLLTYWSRVRLAYRRTVLPSWGVDVFFQHPSP